MLLAHRPPQGRGNWCEVRELFVLRSSDTILIPIEAKASSHRSHCAYPISAEDAHLDRSYTMVSVQPSPWTPYPGFAVTRQIRLSAAWTSG